MDDRKGVGKEEVVRSEWHRQYVARSIQASHLVPWSGNKDGPVAQ
jgi:hypothetical protein